MSWTFDQESIALDVIQVWDLGDNRIDRLRLSKRVIDLFLATLSDVTDV